MDTLSTQEVARLLKVSERTLLRWRTSNPPTGPIFLTIGASIRYPVAALVDFVESNITLPQKESA